MIFQLVSPWRITLRTLECFFPESRDSLSIIGVGVALSSPRKLSRGATTTVSASSPDEVSSKDVWLLAAGSSRKSHSSGTYKIQGQYCNSLKPCMYAIIAFFPMLYILQDTVYCKNS